MNQKKIFTHQNLYPLTIFFLTWGILWGWMRLIRWLLPVDASPDSFLRPYMGVVPEANPWLEVWQRWDVLHYQAIAERGYAAFETSLFTPPLYPFMMKFAGIFFNGNTLSGGMVISLVCCAAALTAFYRLSLFELGNEKLAQRSLIYLAVFPTTFFLFAPYTESLFMLGSVMSLLCMRQKNWLAAGLWGALAASSRLTGALLFLPLLWGAWIEWEESRNWSALIAPILVAIAAAVFPLYAKFNMGLSIMAPFTAQSQRFHGGFTIPGLNIFEALQQVFAGNFPVTNFLDVFFTILFLVLGIPVWKKLPGIYGVYYTGFMILYLTRIADIYPLLSMARYVLALFPAFLILSEYGENPVIHRLVVYLSIPGALFLSAQFAIWGWVG